MDPLNDVEGNGVVHYRAVTNTDKAYQDNKLIEGRLQHLSLREQKLVLLAFSRVKKDDEYGQTYALKIKEILELLEYDTDKGHSEIRKSAQKLAEKGIFIEEKKGWVYYPWFSMIRYAHDKGEIYVRFDRDVTDMIKNLKKNFTPMELREIYGAKCAYSIKIFQLLKQYYPNIDNRYLTIEELKLKLGIENKYKNRTDNLRKVVLEAAREDMNKNASLSFDYEMVKKGVKIVGVNFTIIDNKGAMLKKLKTEKSTLEAKPMLKFYRNTHKLTLYGISEQIAYQLANDVGEEDLGKIIEGAEQLNKNGAIGVENIAGTIINMVQSHKVKNNAAEIAALEQVSLKKVREEQLQYAEDNQNRTIPNVSFSFYDERMVSITIRNPEDSRDIKSDKAIYGADDFFSRIEKYLVKGKELNV